MDATTKFFEGLELRGHERSLEKVTGTLRFDLTNGKRTERWFVEIAKGDIAVSHKNAKADCVVRTASAVFDGIAKGQVNPVTAVLQGTMGLEGDPEVLVLFRRLMQPPRRES